ncbi:MAG: hypothetical protein WCC87_00930 [Candidatus Korobacteraceae bacterium]
MDYLLEILRHQPMMITAGGLLAVLQFAANKLRARQSIQKKQQLRERVIALNAFVISIKELSDASDSHAACLQDALRERDLVLKQLATCGANRLTGSSRGTQRNGCFSCMRLPVRPDGFSIGHFSHWSPPR